MYNYYYARINLSETSYKLHNNYEILGKQHTEEIQSIYHKYCKYKQFKSVLPLFDSEITDVQNDVIGYFHQGRLVAFNLSRRYDSENVESIQFAWDYEDPALRLGIRSLEHECAYYKSLGFKYLYIGAADQYKSEIDGFEILPGLT